LNGRTAVPALADKPDAGDDGDLAAGEAETWQRGHDCADQVEGWREWWGTRAAK
jgi:hypothetical protein